MYINDTIPAPPPIDVIETIPPDTIRDNPIPEITEIDNKIPESEEENVINAPLVMLCLSFLSLALSVFYYF